MSDAWDDSDDDWDNDDDGDDELDKRLGLTKINDAPKNSAAVFDDEDEDLTVKEKAASDKANSVTLKAKGSALADKKAKEASRKEEMELARKAMAIEAEAEANMTPEERRLKERQREEDDAAEMAGDLFGDVDAPSMGQGPGVGTGKVMNSGDKVKLKDLKDHLRHAKKVGECIQGHGKINFCSAFLKEVIQQCKDVLDDDAITDIIKSCNVIKNEKVQASKRKVKGQAQKSKKVDKVEKKKAMAVNEDLFGDNDNYDEYDQMGGDYEDDFF